MESREGNRLSPVTDRRRAPELTLHSSLNRTLCEVRVTLLRCGSQGTLWTATVGGVSRVSNGHITTLTSNNRGPCNTVHWSMEHIAHDLWLSLPVVGWVFSRPVGGLGKESEAGCPNHRFLSASWCRAGRADPLVASSEHWIASAIRCAGQHLDRLAMPDGPEGSWRLLPSRQEAVKQRLA